MDRESLVRTSPLRWLLQASLLGALIGLGVQAAAGGPLWHASKSMGVGVIFSLVMWGGFDLFHIPVQHIPRHWSAGRIGMASVAWMLLLYSVLLATSILLGRLFTGVNFLQFRLLQLYTHY